MKLKNYLSLLTLLYVPLSLFSQSYEWGGQFGGNGEDVVKKMHVDAAGNSYITGYFTDTADFDISEAEFNLTAIGFYDAFVQKTNAEGELLWAVGIGGDMFEYGTGIATDNQGNVYITGYFDETVDFDPGIGEFLLTSQGGGDIFILKLDSEGRFIWAKSIGGADYEESTSIGVDELGNIYTLGYLSDIVDFDPGPGEVLISSQGLNDTFLLKLDNSGNFLNVYTYGGDNIDLALDMFVKNSSQIFISGFFGGTTDLDPRPNEEYIVTATEDFAGYTMEIDDTGAIQNIANTEGGDVNVYAVTADVNDNMYITGNFSGTVNFDPTSGNSDFTFSSTMAYNGFVMKILANGSIDWVRQVASESPVFTYDIIVGEDGQVYTSGFFEGVADFNPSSTEEFFLSKQSVNAMDAYLLVLDRNGLFLNAYQFGGVGFIDTHQMGIDSENNIYLAAQFAASIDINPMPQETQTVTAVDFRDNYLIKMNMGVLGLPSMEVNEFSVYPNPTNQFLKVSTHKNLVGENYAIYNTLGQLIMHGTFTENQYIDVSALKGGIYFLNLFSHSSVKFLKY